jgi:SAM-dependent methyltransferase
MLDARYTFVRCRCGLVFINPQPDEEWLREYYDADYDVQPYQRRKILRKSEKVLKLVRKHGRGRRLLDVGASYGYFLERARSKGYKVRGIETSEKACRAARKRGIPVRQGTLEGTVARGKGWDIDILTMLDVMEHLPRPERSLRKAHETLREGGIIVLTVPNGESTEFRTFGRRWEWASPPAHLWLFTPSTIARLLENEGFEVVHLETYEGDTAGNLLFHAYLALRESVFYGLRLVVGKRRLLEYRSHARTTMTARAVEQDREFTGFSGAMKSLSGLLGFMTKGADKRRNREGRGPSILVIARKKEGAA